MAAGLCADSLGLPSPGFKDGSEASRNAICTGAAPPAHLGLYGAVHWEGWKGARPGSLLPAHPLPAQLEQIETHYLSQRGKLSAAQSRAECTRSCPGFGEQAGQGAELARPLVPRKEGALRGCQSGLGREGPGQLGPELV